MFQEPEVEDCENRNDRDIRDQPLPNVISEEENVHGDDNCEHQHDVEQASALVYHSFIVLHGWRC